MNQDNEFDQKSADHGCLQSLIEVFLYLDGQLDDQESDNVRVHLDHCQKCFGKVEFEKMVKDYIKAKSSKDSPSPEMVKSVNKMLESF